MARHSQIRLLLVDDHQIVREGLRALLAPEPDIALVGEAADGQEALRLALSINPDVVLMDLALRGQSGFEATRALRAAAPGIPVLVLSMYDDPATVDRALRQGARGYVVKGRGLDTLVTAIRQVARGETYLSPELDQQILPGYAGGNVDSPLSAREIEVLSLLCKGLKGPQIAKELGLSAKTVENHRGRIMEKLGIHTTAGLVRYALSMGME